MLCAVEYASSLIGDRKLLFDCIQIKPHFGCCSCLTENIFYVEHYKVVCLQWFRISTRLLRTFGIYLWPRIFVVSHTAFFWLAFSLVLRIFFFLASIVHFKLQSPFFTWILIFAKLLSVNHKTSVFGKKCMLWVWMSAYILFTLLKTYFTFAGDGLQLGQTIYTSWAYTSL